MIGIGIFLTITNEELSKAKELLSESIRETGRYPGRYELASQMNIGESHARRLINQIKKDGLAGTKDTFQAFKRDRQIKDLERRLREALESRVLDERYEKFIAEVSARKVQIPKWIASKPKTSDKLSRPSAFLSDGHFDEIVDPKQVEYMNGYDRQLALERLERFFPNCVKLSRSYLQGLRYDGFILPIGGDMFSGNIHEELRETNEGTLCESLLVYLEPMCAGIRLLADNFERVFVPCVVGNHPRGTRKPRHKTRVRDNFDWLLYRLMEREFSGDPRVSFLVSESADAYWTVFGTRYRLTHGDQFRGGSGIAAELSPMMIGDARKKKRSQAAGNPYDYLLVGHWHRYFPRVKGILANGSIKGYDEYAYHGNFDFEKPQQAYWITDQHDGMTISAPIHVQGKNEWWMEKQKGRSEKSDKWWEGAA